MCVTKCKERGTVLGHVFRFVSETALKSCFVTSGSLVALFVSKILLFLVTEQEEELHSASANEEHLFMKMVQANVWRSSGYLLIIQLWIRASALFHKVLRCLKANWIWSQEETGIFRYRPQLNMLHVGWLHKINAAVSWTNVLWFCLCLKRANPKQVVAINVGLTRIDRRHMRKGTWRDGYCRCSSVFVAQNRLWMT